MNLHKANVDIRNAYRAALSIEACLDERVISRDLKACVVDGHISRPTSWDGESSGGTVGDGSRSNVSAYW